MKGQTDKQDKQDKITTSEVLKEWERLLVRIGLKYSTSDKVYSIDFESAERTKDRIDRNEMFRQMKLYVIEKFSDNKTKKQFIRKTRIDKKDTWFSSFEKWLKTSNIIEFGKPFTSQNARDFLGGSVAARPAAEIIAKQAAMVIDSDSALVVWYELEAGRITGKAWPLARYMLPRCFAVFINAGVSEASQKAIIEKYSAADYVDALKKALTAYLETIKTNAEFLSMAVSWFTKEDIRILLG